MEIDDSSLNELGSWPWSREIHADLIEIINREDADVIAFDIIFDKPDDLAGDKKFSNTLKKYDNIVLASALDLSLTRGWRINEISLHAEHVPIHEFSDHAQTGHINLIPDHDGKIRRKYSKDILKEIPSFSWIVSKFYSHENVEEFNFTDNKIRYINYRQDDFSSISYKDVLVGDFSREYFNDKIVLIGVKSQQITDYWTTPLSLIKGYTFGIDIHAEVISNYINNSFIYKVNNWVFYILLLFFIPATLILFYKMVPVKGVFLLIGIILLIFIISFIVMVYFNVFLEVIPFIFFASINYALSNIIWYYKIEKNRKQIYEMFSRYLAPEVVKKVWENKEDDRFSGEKVMITILFVDIVGFTSFSENKSPEEVVSVLNRYLKLIIEEVFKYKGTLDKFLGDGAMIFFGAPVRRNDHAQRAVRLAKSLQKKINNNSNFPLKLSIGINTGEAVVGNVGSQKRKEYTAIGNAVNLASRIEAAAGENMILIGEDTLKRLQEQDKFILLEKMIKGKAGKTKIYKLENKR